MEDPILSTLKRIQRDQAILSKLSVIAESDITPGAGAGDPDDDVVKFLNRILGNPEALRVFKEIMRPGPGIASGEGEAAASSTRSLGNKGLTEGVQGVKGVDTRGRSASFARRTRKRTKKNTKKRQTIKKHNKTKRRR